ncbi:unnamed protein product [Prorocentrum cordatum]|uniref:Secreted protein n=1 Tax=Prorocentrum cordatum TaxID=2364126 RepID=A0ABN9QR15_9DINO|nr:unnamed protein product [Polarella glacialis]
MEPRSASSLSLSLSFCISLPGVPAACEGQESSRVGGLGRPVPRPSARSICLVRRLGLMPRPAPAAVGTNSFPKLWRSRPRTVHGRAPRGGAPIFRAARRAICGSCCCAAGRSPRARRLGARMAGESAWHWRGPGTAPSGLSTPLENRGTLSCLFSLSSLSLSLSLFLSYWSSCRARGARA